MKKNLRIGTRGSVLALIQAEEVKNRILAAHPHIQQDYVIEIIPISTSGDWRPSQGEARFSDMGGNKELFSKELDEALLAGFIDCAQHSMKDVPTFLAPGLEIISILERQTNRDVFISAIAPDLQSLPQGARVGTSSLRRQAQILALRPDLRVEALRGNIDTRLKKLDSGQADAAILAGAALHRMGLSSRITSVIDPSIMLPASAQGAIGIMMRADDNSLRDILAKTNHLPSQQTVIAERALLQTLDGSCQTPIGAMARIEGDVLHLDALLARPDGSEVVRMSDKGNVAQADAIGIQLGEKMKAHHTRLFAA